MNLKQLFQYQPSSEYPFILNAKDASQAESKKNKQETSQEVYTNIDLNLKFIQNKYSASINSDIMIREFSLTARNTRL